MEQPAPSDDLLDCLSGDFVEDLFQQYRENPSAVGAEWRSYFASLNGSGAARLTSTPASPAPSSGACVSLSQEKVDRLVWAFRYWGHLAADIDPLGLRGVGESFWADLHPTYQLRELTIKHHGLAEDDLDELFSSPLSGRDE